MGNSQSMSLIDGFSPEEVSRLEKRFKKLDLVSKTADLKLEKFNWISHLTNLITKLNPEIQ